MAQKTVLVVDDQRIVRVYVRSVLEGEGLQVIEAADGIDALEILQKHGPHIDALLTDIVMPRMNGLDLAASAKQTYPSMPVILMTGYSTPPSDTLKNCHFIAKPFPLDALLDLIRPLLSE